MIESMNSTNLLTIVLVSFISFSFMESSLTRNYSSVDRLWSITPSVYAFISLQHGAFNQRSIVMFALISIWGIRLTHNFHRKGGYRRGEEDYRWNNLREMRMLRHPIVWAFFNLTFISIYQHTLLFMITLPCVYVAEMNSSNNAELMVALNGFDFFASASFLFFLFIETKADNEQFAFQEAKKMYREGKTSNDNTINDKKFKNDLKNGFLSQGLFARSRHPNFFSEQMIWWSLCVFAYAQSNETSPLFLKSCKDLKSTTTSKYFIRIISCSVRERFNVPICLCSIHYVFLGAILLSLLFQGSTNFTESITSKKYAMYKVYQKKVNRLIPSLFSNSVAVVSEDDAARTIQQRWKEKEKKKKKKKNDEEEDSSLVDDHISTKKRTEKKIKKRSLLSKIFRRNSKKDY